MISRFTAFFIDISYGIFNHSILAIGSDILIIHIVA